MRDAEKAKIEATKSEEMKTEERVEESIEKDEEMTDANKPELSLKTGLLKDGTKVCPPAYGPPWTVHGLKRTRSSVIFLASVDE